MLASLNYARTASLIILSKSPPSTSNTSTNQAIKAFWKSVTYLGVRHFFTLLQDDRIRRIIERKNL